MPKTLRLILQHKQLIGRVKKHALTYIFWGGRVWAEGAMYSLVRSLITNRTIYTFRRPLKLWDLSEIHSVSTLNINIFLDEEL